MSDVNARDIDASLVDRLRQGDGDALGALYLRYGASVRGFLARVVPGLSDEDIDDLGQETFMTFADGLHRYEHQGRLHSWLFGIAVRKARSALRRRRWRRAMGLQTGAPAAGVALGQARADDQVDARQRIDRLIRSLPAPQREILVLTAVEGLSVKEAATVLGIRENAASTRLYRARKAMAAAEGEA
ncbi:MAG: sigma-70 family RNA polymerase sigma factor [Myxococcota bacterium]